MSQRSGSRERSQSSQQSGALAVQKRALVNALDQARGGERHRTDAPPQSVQDARAVLAEALSHDPNLRSCLETLSRALDQGRNAQEALTEARANAGLLQETVESFESKLLGAIRDQGRLHQEMDAVQAEAFGLRKEIATLTRQRDALRARVVDLREQGDLHRRALAAAEQELLYLNARLLARS